MNLVIKSILDYPGEFNLILCVLKGTELSLAGDRRLMREEEIRVKEQDHVLEDGRGHMARNPGSLKKLKETCG